MGRKKVVPEPIGVPFVGARPFNKNESKLFHGRDSDVTLIAARVLAEQLVVVCGPSGVGKTSLVEAGLKQYLTEFHIDVRSESQPGAALAALIELAKSPVGSGTSDEPDQVFAIDQFERVLRKNDDRELAASAIAKALRQGHRIVLVLREEALSWLVHIKSQVPTVLTNVVRLDPLSPAGIHDAIVEPLRVYNERQTVADQRVEVHPALIEGLASRLAGDSLGRGRNGATALQVVMRGLWDHAFANGLKMLAPPPGWRAEQKAAEWIDEVLRKYVDRCLAALSPHLRSVCWRLLAQLLHPLGGRLVVDLQTLEGDAPLTKWLHERALTDLQRVGLVVLDERTRTAEMAHDFIAEEIASRLKQRKIRAQRIGVMGLLGLCVGVLSFGTVEFVQYRNCARETPLVESRCEDAFVLGESVAATLFQLGTERVFAQRYARDLSTPRPKACSEPRLDADPGLELAAHLKQECGYLHKTSAVVGYDANAKPAGDTVVFQEPALAIHHRLHQLMERCEKEDHVPTSAELEGMQRFFQKRIGDSACTTPDVLMTKALRNCVRIRNRKAAEVLKEVFERSLTESIPVVSQDVDADVEMFLAMAPEEGLKEDTLREGAKLWMRAAAARRAVPIARELATYLGGVLSASASKPPTTESPEVGRHLSAYKTLELTWRDDIQLLPGMQGVCIPGLKLSSCNQRAPELIHAHAGFVREATAASGLIARAAGSEIPSDFVSSATILVAHQAMALAIAGPTTAGSKSEWVDDILEYAGLVDALVKLPQTTTELMGNKCSAEVARALATLHMSATQSLTVKSVATACRRCRESAETPSKPGQMRLELQNCGRLLDAGKTGPICSSDERRLICTAIQERSEFLLPRACSVVASVGQQ
jgi:hypothetical protein